MAIYPELTPEPQPEAEAIYTKWLLHLDDEFTRHTQPERRAELVRDELFQIYLGHAHGGRPSMSLQSELSGIVLQYNFDPANVTLEPEIWGDVDQDQFAQRKPLLYFWHMFDRSPLGLNLWLGLRFRRVLAKHLFAHVGKGVQIHHNVEITCGNNLSIGNNVILRQNTLLDDRGGITIEDGVFLGPATRIYTHERSAENIHDITLKPVQIGANAHIGSHAVLLPGTTIAANQTVPSPHI